MTNRGKLSANETVTSIRDFITELYPDLEYALVVKVGEDCSSNVSGEGQVVLGLVWHLVDNFVHEYSLYSGKTKILAFETILDALTILADKTY